MAASATAVIETPRTILRDWTDGDMEAWFQICADPRVMQFYPSGPQTSEAATEVGEKIRKYLRENPYGMWALQIKGGPEFAGFVGLQNVPFESHFTPAVEIGWRLAFNAWGHGYVTEASRAILDRAWNEYALSEVVAMTIPRNVRSRRVMERLGMTYNPADDFDNPRLPEGNSFRRHVLYRIKPRMQ